MSLGDGTLGLRRPGRVAQKRLAHSTAVLVVLPGDCRQVEQHSVIALSGSNDSTDNSRNRPISPHTPEERSSAKFFFARRKHRGLDRHLSGTDSSALLGRSRLEILRQGRH